MLATLATALALTAPAPGGAWAPDVAAAEAFARTRRGEISWAVRTPCGAWGRREDRAVPSASVLKAMLLVAFLRRSGVRDRPLNAGQRRLLAPMIRESSNRAATRVLDIVGPARLYADAARWRMPRFVLRRPWGTSTITAREQARFWLHLDAHVPARHRGYALGLLRTIVAPQRWGVAQVAPAGWILHFKGGWGSRSGAVEHQVALLTRDGQRVSLAIMSTAQGSHVYGQRTLEGMARRLLTGVDSVPTRCPLPAAVSSPS